MTVVSERLKQVLDMFLSPDMKNLDLLERQIQKIWEATGEGMIESPVRVGHTSNAPYIERIKDTQIPNESVPFDALVEELAFYYNGLIKWNSPGVMINITPPPLIAAVAASACGNVFNPNLAMDVPSGNMAFAEIEVIKMICDLVHWNIETSTGLMTFGGKGTVLYAIRTGLNACYPDARYKGISRGEVKVFSTEQGHPCHYENCEWLGIGSENCTRIPVLKNGQMNTDVLRDELEKTIKSDIKIACIIVNGGSTLYTTVDEIAKVVAIRDDLVKKYNLSYIPHIHVDSVIGWAWLMFDTYDFNSNPLEFSEKSIEELKFVYEHVKEITLADSFGVDFHKTGYSPYLCSMFVCKDKKRVYGLGDVNQAPVSELEYGLYAPFTYTLESSRAGVSAIEAWISLRQLGKGGYQRIIGTMVETGCSMRKHFSQAPYSVCRNTEAHGFVALAMLFPRELRERSKEELETFDDEELIKIAKYNHKFYLYILSLNARNAVPFLLDYVSKHTTIKTVKIGVIKLFPMSPFCNLDYLDSFYSKFEEVLTVFDSMWEDMKLDDSPYRPKPFVTR